MAPSRHSSDEPWRVLVMSACDTLRHIIITGGIIVIINDCCFYCLFFVCRLMQGFFYCVDATVL